MDLRHAYLQIELDEESKEFSTINIHKGLFQIDSLVQRLPRVSAYLDDIHVSGVDEEDHLNNLDKVLHRLESAVPTLKKSKCVFGLDSIEYLGHIIDMNGLHSSTEKVKAIAEAPTPTNVTELKSFLGLINYYNKFLSILSMFLSPLYRLLKKRTRWYWLDDQEKAFKQAKQILESSSLLVHFDPSKDLILLCDASPYGVGGVLSFKMEDGSEKPIAFTSRTISNAEKKYSQLEKEGLTIVFLVKRFHQYLNGRLLSICSDHQPLKYLFNEFRQTAVMASSRIQCCALTLGAYKHNIRHNP